MKSKVEKINLFPVKICKTKCQNHEKIKKFMMDFVYDHFCKHGLIMILEMFTQIIFLVQSRLTGCIYIIYTDHLF